MAAKDKAILKKLNEIRARNLPRFQEIKLTPQAIDYASKLFLHPFCVATVNLKKFVRKKPVKLAHLAKHIITAFPNTISFYSQEHEKTLINDQDILECFAIDHINGIRENKIESAYSPAYALAHLLTLCKAINLRIAQSNRLTDLEYQCGAKKIIFKNVFVPKDLKIKRGDRVFHHFGAVIDYVQNKNLADLFQKLRSKQRQEEYLSRISTGIFSVIDFGKPGLYPFDLDAIYFKKNQNPEIAPEIRINLNQRAKIPFTK